MSAMGVEQQDVEAGPIVCTRRVDVDPVHAFEVFTERLGDWWDPRLTPDPGTYEGADVEEVEGGVVALHHDGEDYPIGEVQEWSIGERFAMTFHLTLPRDHPTVLEVDFEPSEGGTLVTLTHGGWGPDNQSHRGRFTEWPNLLERFAATAVSE
ncbi:SRPBCC domain-containing protein [Ornithinimicrobium cavernae]|uniref:SRPBCC domain-containing protein n=1 Tax=Ornithinimicrobium cavernae TaxID=2666047 RepID=UPI000D69081F|nr:SRPBCC domain-containing protein [Ornithinimicrobium cavernae]